MSGLKKFMSKKSPKKDSKHQATGQEGGDGLEDSYQNVHSNGKTGLSASLNSQLGLYPSTLDASGFGGFERDSSYSCVSGASSEYAPRAAAEGGSTRAAGLGAATAPNSSGDAPDAILPAIRYVYDSSTCTWGHQYVHLRILHPNRGVDQDDVHVYFACDLMLLHGHQLIRGSTSCESWPGGLHTAQAVAPVRDTRQGPPGAVVGKTIPMLARLFRHTITDVVDEDYFGSGQAQAVAESLAHQFNRYPVALGVRRLPLPLLTNRCVCRINVGGLPEAYRQQRTGFFPYTTTDSHDIMMLLEPDVRECKAIGVSFSMKFSLQPPLPSTVPSVNPLSPSAQEDDVCAPFDTKRFDRNDLKRVAEAFSHFTLSQSKGQLMVHGLLYQHGYLLDPLVYTHDRRGYGMGNGGPNAIRHWTATHRCNELCCAYRLEPVNSIAVEDAAETSASGKGGKEATYGAPAAALSAKGRRAVEKQTKKDREKAEKEEKKLRNDEKKRKSSK